MRTNILITGASSGLGMAMAREFAKKGRNLALCARRLDQLEALRSELGAAHPNIRIVIKQLDVCEYGRVFEVFDELNDELGGIDRIVVNAGIGSGAPLGTGGFHANRRTMETNVVAALAQTEAAMKLFRERNAGHLVMISSVSAYRGQPGAMTTYSATKAAIAQLMEGIRMEMMGSPIRFTTLFPGFIRTAINEDIQNRPFLVELDEGSRHLARAIEAELTESSIPKWPWSLVGFALRILPLWAVRKIY